ncbi:MAG: tetratricopeptide repeat protein, partial [Candidatus Heimdallarchaeota archaeon]|nr:tetratricopeptide repeat protein [Candidatus Heimdallarchaeota archaeon]MCK5049703.1 tetratricopeptide repeat protein [Candidatus Heimdallarchaeota archaeon]
IAETLIENQKFHEAELYYRQIAELANKEPVIEIARSDALFGMGLIEIHEGEYDLALGYLRRSMIIREELDVQEKIALTHNQIGICYGHLGKPERAVEFYQKSLEIQEKLEQPVGVADLLFNIGFSKMRSEKYEEARVFLESSLQIQEQKIDNIKKAKTLNLLSLIELQLQNNFYALEQLIDAQECLSGREKDLNAIINFNMSQVYRVRDDFVKATEKLERALHYWNSDECIDVNRDRKISVCCITKAINLYLNKDETNKALHFQTIIDGLKASLTEFSDMSIRNVDDFVRTIFFLSEGEITNARTTFDLSKNALEKLEWYNFMIYYHLLVIEQNIKEYETLSVTPLSVLENIKKDILISISIAERHDLSRSLILLNMSHITVLVMTKEKEKALELLNNLLETVSEQDKSDFLVSLKQWASVLETNLSEEGDVSHEKVEQLFYEIYQELRDINSIYEMNVTKEIDIIGKVSYL